MGFNSNLSTHILCVHSTNEGKISQNVVQVYLSGILAYKGRSLTILSDNGTEVKNKVLNEVCDQLGIK